MMFDRNSRNSNAQNDKSNPQNNQNPRNIPAGLAFNTGQTQPVQQQNLAGKLISKAGNFLKNDIYDDIKQTTKSALSGLKNTQPSVEKMDQQIMEVLITENRSIKQALQKSVAENEELKEKAETLKQLEEEASEENEVLQFKVMSLEAQAQIEGKDMTKVKLLDEMRHAKKQLHKEVNQLQSKLKAIESLGFGVNDLQQNELSNDNNEDDFKQTLDQFRMLHDLYKVEFTEKQQVQLMTSLIVGDQQIQQHFRTRLYQIIAKKAIEKAELLYQSCSPPSASSDQNMPVAALNTQSVQGSSKLYIENKKLKNQTKSQDEQIQSLQNQLSHSTSTNLVKQKQTEDKVIQLKKIAKSLKTQLEQLRIAMMTLKSEAEESRDFGGQFLQPNMKLLLSSVQKYSADTQVKLKEAHKAVFEKNKAISDQFMKITTLEKQIKDNQQNNTLIYEKNKQIGDLFNQNNQLKQENEELSSKMQKLQADYNKLSIEALVPQPKNIDTSQIKSKQGNNNPQWEEQKANLEAKIEELSKELKQMRHEHTFNSIKNAKSGSKELEEYKSALIDKNKMISEMFNKQNDNMKIIAERDDEIEQLRQELSRAKQGDNSQSSRSVAQSKPATGGSSARIGGGPTSSGRGEQAQANDFFGGFFGSIKNQIQQQIFGEEEQDNSNIPSSSQNNQYKQTSSKQNKQQTRYEEQTSPSPPKQQSKWDKTESKVTKDVPQKEQTNNDADDDDFFNFDKPASSNKQVGKLPLQKNVISFGGSVSKAQDQGKLNDNSSQINSQRSNASSSADQNRMNSTQSQQQMFPSAPKSQIVFNKHNTLTNDIFNQQKGVDKLTNDKIPALQQSVSFKLQDDKPNSSLDFLDQIEKTKPDLNFLNDMFTGLLGNTISNDLTTQKNVKADKNLNLDQNQYTKQEPQSQNSKNKIQASGLPQVGFRQQINKNQSKSLGQEKPNIQAQTNNDLKVNLGWQNEEPLDIDLDDLSTLEQNTTQNLKQAQDKSIDNDHKQETNEEQNQNIILQQKQETKGWGDNDNSLDIDIEVSEQPEDVQPLQDTKQIITENKKSTSPNKSDKNSSSKSPQKQDLAKNQKVSSERKLEEGGWQDEDLGIDIDEEEQEDKLGVDDLIGEDQVHDDIFPSEIHLKSQPHSIEVKETDHYTIMKQASLNNEKTGNQSDQIIYQQKYFNDYQQLDRQQEQQNSSNNQETDQPKPNKEWKTQENLNVETSQNMWGDDDNIDIEDIEVQNNEQQMSTLIDKDEIKEEIDEALLTIDNQNESNYQQKQDLIKQDKNIDINEDQIENHDQNQNEQQSTNREDENGHLSQQDLSPQKQSNQLRMENESTLAQKCVSNYELASSQDLSYNPNLKGDLQNLDELDQEHEEDLEEDRGYESDKEPNANSPGFRHLDPNSHQHHAHRAPLSTISNPHMTLQYDNDLKDVESQGWGIGDQNFELEINGEDDSIGNMITPSHLNKQAPTTLHKYDILSNRAQNSQMRDKDLTLFSPPSDLKRLEGTKSKLKDYQSATRGSKQFDYEIGKETYQQNSLVQEEQQLRDSVQQRQESEKSSKSLTNLNINNSNERANHVQTQILDQNNIQSDHQDQNQIIGDHLQQSPGYVIEQNVVANHNINHHLDQNNDVKPSSKDQLQQKTPSPNNTSKERVDQSPLVKDLQMQLSKDPQVTSQQQEPIKTAGWSDDEDLDIDNDFEPESERGGTFEEENKADQTKHCEQEESKAQIQDNQAIKVSSPHVSVKKEKNTNNYHKSEDKKLIASNDIAKKIVTPNKQHIVKPQEQLGWGDDIDISLSGVDSVDVGQAAHSASRQQEERYDDTLIGSYEHKKEQDEEVQVNDEEELKQSEVNIKEEVAKNNSSSPKENKHEIDENKNTKMTENSGSGVGGWDDDEIIDI